MTEEEIREEIARQLYLLSGFTLGDSTWEQLGRKEHWYMRADQILAIEGIRIEAENQELPLDIRYTRESGDWYIINKILSAGFVKCLPKERNDRH